MRVAGKYEKLARERQEKDLALARQPGGHPRGLVWVPEAGERVIKFVEGYCCHHKGEWAGKPLLLEDWQKDALRQAFGWYRKDGLRRFRTLYLEVPRKNGKSEIAGAVGLYLVLGDGEPGAEVYSSATKKDQAKIVWGVAAAMVRRSRRLRKWVTPYKNSLHIERNESSFAPLGADSKTLDGLNPHGNIIDELHAHRDRSVWDVLDTAMGARRQPMTIAITTAGTFAPESIGWEMHDYACKVLENYFEDDGFFALIYAADEDDDHFSERTHRKANPNYGVSVKPEYLSAQSEKAKRQPSFLNEYLRLHLNVWTQNVTRWLSMTDWAECEPGSDITHARALVDARETSLMGQSCWAGVDLSSKLDLTALVLTFPKPDNVLDVVCRFWLPEETVKAYTRKGMRHYETWAREGWLTATPGSVIDYDFIRQQILQLSTKYHITQVAYDPWSATQLATQLQGEGMTVVEMRQGFKTMSEPSKDLAARVAAHKVRHANNPVLRFCASNAVVVSDPAENIRPDKGNSRGRIDGVVALIMGLGRASSSPTTGRSYLETQEMVILG